MEVRRVSDPSEFLADAGALLLRDEARHNLILGLAGILRDQPDRYDEFRLWLVESAGEVVGAALQTPPHNLVLARPLQESAHETLARALTDDGIELPGVVAAVPEADHFSDAWEARIGVERVRRVSQRIYQLTRLRAPRGVEGRARITTDRDVPLLIDWVEAFAEEAFAGRHGPASDTEHMVRSRLEANEGGFMLWETGGPVSLAGWGGPTPNGARIGPVYTPPDKRGRGYGAAVTAAVSEMQLARGKRFCFLYTDLANPTSNGIYQAIGYHTVAEVVRYTFDPPH